MSMEKLLASFKPLDSLTSKVTSKTKYCVDLPWEMFYLLYFILIGPHVQRKERIESIYQAKGP